MIFLCQTSVSITGAARHVQAVAGRRMARDNDLLIKTVLTETFGGPVLRPWAMHALHDGVATIVAYSGQTPEALNDARALSLPSLRQVVGEVIGGPMPALGPRQRFGFEVRLCPTIHVTKDGKRRHGERDAFLVAVEKASEHEPASREGVYRDYLAQRIEGAELNAVTLRGFRLNRMTRKSATTEVGQRVVPEALLQGALTLNDAAAFEKTIAQGIGRQRAFGHGMIRLQPIHAKLA